MSTDAVPAFIERLSTDQAFRDQLEAASSPQERQQIANDAGYDVGPDDVGAIRSAAGIEELSDEDLEKVAGGVSDTYIVMTVIGGASAAGIGAAAAI